MSFGHMLWAMVVFFFSVMAIWVFIVIFGDIFHRRDLSGGAKAGSCLLIFVIRSFGRSGHHHHC
jgi:hypothetical protein